VPERAPEEEVQEDRAHYGEQDHEPNREVNREVPPPEDEVARKPVQPEAAEQQEDTAEYEQHYCASDQKPTETLQAHDHILERRYLTVRPRA
jgi:hypothetical protein